MHKQYLNHCTIEITLEPDTPLLIKSGEEGADPTKPDMEFVDTFYQGNQTIYLPGSSLKGAIRAHAERIVRTIGGEQKPTDDYQLWANDPINNDRYLDNESEDVKNDPKALYKKSSFTDQLFGNTYVASRVRIEDAYPVELSQIQVEERNGVAIDRVFGSVSVGPFNYQVCTAGEFKTRIHLKNFTLAQLGLIGLVLRDLNEGWFNIGFAKSRGMGSVTVTLNQATVQYPSCMIENDHIVDLKNNQSWPINTLLGVGKFLEPEECRNYGFPQEEPVEIPIGGEAMDYNFGVQLNFSGEETVNTLFPHAVTFWKQLINA